MAAVSGVVMVCRLRFPVIAKFSTTHTTKETDMTAVSEHSADFPSGVTLVIGGSGGIGRSICREFARAGSDVAVTYFSREANAQQTAEDFTLDQLVIDNQRADFSGRIFRLGNRCHRIPIRFGSRTASPQNRRASTRASTE